jgi:hypothetical protein
VASPHLFACSAKGELCSAHAENLATSPNSSFDKPRAATKLLRGHPGEIENPDGVGEVGNPICGDMMKITIKVEDARIENIKFLTFGCGAAIAVSSMLTEMAKGKRREEAKKIKSNTN